VQQVYKQVLDWERGELLPGEGRKGELYIVESRQGSWFEQKDLVLRKKHKMRPFMQRDARIVSFQDKKPIGRHHVRIRLPFGLTLTTGKK